MRAWLATTSDANLVSGSFYFYATLYSTMMVSLCLLISKWETEHENDNNFSPPRARRTCHYKFQYNFAYLSYQTKCFLLFRNDSFFCVSHLTNFMLAVGVIHAGTNRRRRESSAQFKHWRRFAREKQNRSQLMIKWNFLFINSEGQTECFFVWTFSVLCCCFFVNWSRQESSARIESYGSF